MGILLFSVYYYHYYYYFIPFIQTVTACKEIEERSTKKLDIRFCTFKHKRFQHLASQNHYVLFENFILTFSRKNYFFVRKKWNENSFLEKWTLNSKFKKYQIYATLIQPFRGLSLPVKTINLCTSLLYHLFVFSTWHPNAVLPNKIISCYLPVFPESLW